MEKSVLKVIWEGDSVTPSVRFTFEIVGTDLPLSIGFLNSEPRYGQKAHNAKDNRTHHIYQNSLRQAHDEIHIGFSPC